jgi:hypothetical protein
MKTRALNVLRALFIVMTLFGLFLFGNIGAQEIRYSLTKSITKKLIFEDVYRFYVMRYVPPITIKPFDIKQDQLQKEQLPEKSAKAYFAAQAQGNYAWYESLLSDELMVQLTKKLSAASKTPDDAISELQDKYKHTTIEFTHRVERQSDSIIHYRVISHNGIIQDEQDLAVNFRGQIINFRGDIVYDNWRFTGTTKRIEKIVGRSGDVGVQ